MIKFDYFYGTEADSFSFYRLPRLLIKGEEFRSLSTDAKLLYGLLLDRMGLSIKNNWHDENDQIYIYYPIAAITEDLNCGHDKATKLLNDLKKIGLINRVRQGLGKPDKIYVKRFYKDNHVKNIDSVEVEPDDEDEETPTEDDSDEAQDAEDDAPQRELKKRCQECGETAVSNTVFPSSGVRNKRDPERLVSAGNYTDSIQTEYIYNKSSYTNPSISQEEFDDTMEEVKDQIDYEFLSIQYPGDDVQGLTEIICEVLCYKQKDILIGRERLPMGKVQARFRKLNSAHVGYVIDSLRQCTSKIRNIKSYIITALYNAPMTMDIYYTNLINHDMYGG